MIPAVVPLTVSVKVTGPFKYGWWPLNPSLPSGMIESLATALPLVDPVKELMSNADDPSVPVATFDFH